MSSKQARTSRGGSGAPSQATSYRRNYDVDGLRDLVQQRIGLKPAEGKSKKFYIDILMQDDAMKAANAAAGDKTFPFLDLPAELRNDVYHRLLVAESNPVTGRTAGHPDILRACKQIHEEATGILYNKHTLKLKFRAGRKRGLNRDVRTTCSQTVLTFHSSGASKLEVDFQNLPMHLFNICSLDIDLEIGTTQNAVPTVANNAVFALGDRLAHYGATKQLNVHCHVCPKLEDDSQGRGLLESTLWPLAMLATIPGVQYLVEGATSCDDESTTKGYLLQLVKACKREYWDRSAYVTQAELEMLQKARRLQDKFAELRMQDDARACELDKLITTLTNIRRGKEMMCRGHVLLMIGRHEGLTKLIESDDTLKNEDISRDLQGEKDKSGLSWSRFLTKGTSAKSEAIWCGLRK